MTEFKKTHPLFLFSEIDKYLNSKAILCVFGGYVLISMGMYQRTTDNINIWSPMTEIEDIEDFINACLKVGLSVGDEFPVSEKSVNLALRFSNESQDPIDLGEIDYKEKITLYRGKRLSAVSIPVENLIVSKLCRANKQDLSDCVYMIKLHRRDFLSLKKKAETLKNEIDREKVENYLSMIDIVGLFERTANFDDSFFLEEIGKSKDKEKREARRMTFVEKIKKADFKTIMQARERYVEVIDFIVSRKDPAELLIEKNLQLLSDLINYIRSGLPNHENALSDPLQYRKIRERITELVLLGLF